MICDSKGATLGFLFYMWLSLYSWRVFVIIAPVTQEGGFDEGNSDNRGVKNPEVSVFL